MNRVFRTVLSAAVLTAAFTLVSSQIEAQTERQWIPIDTSRPPGTPPEVKFSVADSDPSNSFFDVFIYGFWKEDYIGPDNQRYSRLEIPQITTSGVVHGSMGHPGAPELPALRCNLAVATRSPDARMGQSFFDVFTIPRFGLVSPEYIPGRDDELGTPPRFVRDEAIYRLQTFWPTTDGISTSPTMSMLGSIMGAQVEVYPVRWNPSTMDLEVARSARYQFIHPGTPVRSPELTKERVRLAEGIFLNWKAVDPYFPENLVLYDAEFLFIYPQAYADELLPLINQKKARGFRVTELTTENTGTTCAAIRAAINAWYTSTPSWRDHYCLLVSDVATIPLCTAPTGDPTDDLYASTNGDDLNEEVYLGRLSVDSEADCTNQVAKILAYEDSPPLFGNFDEALLVAHKEDAPGKYVGAHESVRTAAYAVPPTFTTQYGHIAGVTDATVSGQINAGLGLVAYRGHGNSGAWTTWNTGGQSYDGTDVMGLTNGSMTPVLWSFACNNQELGVEDCVGEVWMESMSNRAVSHYGATVPSYTSQNHELDRQMFKAVYDRGYITQSHAIMDAEAQMAMIAGSDNAWMYLLLGDPDMQIRRRPPLDIRVMAPEVIPICTLQPCEVTIQVFDEEGLPIPGALVGLWKPGMMMTEGLPQDEVFDNRYTDASGRARIPASPQTSGTLTYTVQDDNGNARLGTIEVRQQTDVPFGSAGSLSFRAHPTVMRAGTFLSFGDILAFPATVTIYDVSGRVVQTIKAGPGVGGVTWDGRDDSGAQVRSGLYFAQFVAKNITATTRVVVVR